MGDDIHAELKKLLNERIVVLDGAMGTTIREYGLDESAARGERFKAIKKDILNNGDILSITQSDVIGDIHRKFFEAGSDIASTNTFSATTLAQSEFFVDDPRETGEGVKDQEFFQKIIEDNFINFGYSALEQSIFEITENIGSFLGPNLIGNIINIRIC